MDVSSIGIDVKEIQLTVPFPPTYFKPLGNIDTNPSNNMEPCMIKWQNEYILAKVSEKEKEGQDGLERPGRPSERSGT